MKIIILFLLCASSLLAQKKDSTKLDSATQANWNRYFGHINSLKYPRGRGSNGAIGSLAQDNEKPRFYFGFRKKNRKRPYRYKVIIEGADTTVK